MNEKMYDLKKQVAECRKCSLREGAKLPVFGEGVPGGLLVIGEAPGATEDDLNRPFVGRSGQLLDKILAAIDCSRTTNTYIANIVKCRPPENRTPTPDERGICLPWLMQEIELVNPKVIVLLGATALQALIDKKARLTDYRGKWIDFNGYMTMVTYHPAALLRNPNLKRDVWEDVKKVKEYYESNGINQ